MEPQHRLVTYGTLAPGQPNQHQLERRGCTITPTRRRILDPFPANIVEGVHSHLGDVGHRRPLQGPTRPAATHIP